MRSRGRPLGVVVHYGAQGGDTRLGAISDATIPYEGVAGTEAARNLCQIYRVSGEQDTLGPIFGFVISLAVRRQYHVVPASTLMS